MRNIAKLFDTGYMKSSGCKVIKKYMHAIP